MRSPLLPPPGPDHSKNKAPTDHSVATKSLSVQAGVILVYAMLQILVMSGWIVGGLYLLELLDPAPGGWLIALAIILGGVCASPNIAQWILIAADRRVRSMVIRIQLREAAEEAATTTKTNVRYRPDKRK